MYVPPAFRVDDAAGGLAASHLPMLYNAERQVLLGHLARPDPQAAQEPAAEDGVEAMAVFQGVAGYVSPGSPDRQGVIAGLQSEPDAAAHALAAAMEAAGPR